MKEFTKIGNLKIEKFAALAPMTSVADRAYRLICKEFSASLVFSEMVSCKGIFYNFKTSEGLLKISKEERPMAIQIFGSDPKFFELALSKVLEQKPDLIDINMECPQDVVTKKNAGMALMKNEKLAEKIAKVVVSNSCVPVTVKIGKGWDEENVNAVEFSKRMENAGVSAIIVHGRTKSQMFKGKADWEIISKIKKEVSIPVILNGDVKTLDDCKRAYEETGADLVMIGRGSFGRPFIFSQIREYFENGKILKEPSNLEIVDIMIRHMKKIVEFEGEEKAAKKMRSAAMRYFLGFCNAAKIRKMCCEISSFDDVLKIAEFVKNSGGLFEGIC